MLPVALLVAFLLVPIVEIYVILQVGHLIGAWPTVALLIAESVLGAWIVRREGRRAWRALTTTFRQGAVPERELTNTALVLMGGLLLLTPGFVTDIAGFLFVLPFTRPAVRWALSGYAGRRIRAAHSRRTTGMFAGFGAPGDPRRPPRPEHGQDGAAHGGHEPRVVRGEVIEEDREG